MVKVASRLLRYERKFFIPSMSVQEVEHILKKNSAFFTEIFEPRFINNIYFDSIDKKSFFDNVDGVLNRIKFRIRWYGDLFGKIEKPVLEVKGKEGLLGYKEIYSLKSFTFDKDFNIDRVSALLKDSPDLPPYVAERMATLVPMLVNRYKRKYFSSAFGDFRATIDKGMEYYAVNETFNNFFDKVTDDNNSILELKYSPEDDDKANNITKHFPFRVTKSSKYTTGIDALTNSNML